MVDESDNGNLDDDFGEYELTPDPMGEWYWAEGDQRHGPISEGELRRRITDGLLTSDQLVWRAGMVDWKPAGALAVLRPAFHPDQHPTGAAQGPSETLQYHTASAGYDGIDPHAGQATAAMICGIIAVLFGMPGVCCLPISAITLIMGLIALVLGYNSRPTTTRASHSTAGIVLGWVSLGLCVLACGFTFAISLNN